MDQVNLNNRTFVPGLEGVVAAQTHLSLVDGQAGRLVIAGYPLEEIASVASFEEMVYLLWKGSLPSRRELNTFREALVRESHLSAAVMDLLSAAARSRMDAMDVLRITLGALSLDMPGGLDPWQENFFILGRLPVLVAAYWRMRDEERPLPSQPELSYAANYLYMLRGQVPHPAHVRALETYLNTVIDHGLNASTFTARVIISTGTDLLSALVGALGALKGPLHGGAPGPALDMVFEIGEIEQAEPYLRHKLSQGERLMGFGHRIYKVRDPRAGVLAAAAQQLYQQAGDMRLYQLAKGVEKKALALLEEYKPGRRLQTNVEYYTALVLHGLDLPVPLFTPTFALSRAAGWIAHCREQQSQKKLIRPQSEYIGEMDRMWVPVDER